MTTSSGIDAALVARVMAGDDRRATVELRVVGTASSALRGIATAANDVDVVFRERAGVDEWFGALAADGEVLHEPRWLAPSCQYFARVRVVGAVVELSTVEIDDDGDTNECFGRGPWTHFDVVVHGTTAIPVVATELRLITEIVRGRRDRIGPLVERLRRGPCDRALVRRGLTRAAIAPDDAARLLTALGETER
ncbi:MAG TPA: hypothetical protein VH914_14585 [Acidimicrobiia bacterium]|nr:hypothetical protein [Acidimicrobiia bacterium]